MSASTINQDHPIEYGLAAIGVAIYAAWRTLYLLKLLIPLWIHRIGQAILYDLEIAVKVYAGTNVKIINLDDQPQINHYHTRYEGTQRAAKDTEETI